MHTNTMTYFSCHMYSMSGEAENARKQLLQHMQLDVKSMLQVLETKHIRRQHLLLAEHEP